MSLGLVGLINRPCLIVRRSASGSTDIYGNDVPSESAAASVVELQQTGQLGVAGRTEPAGGGSVTETRWQGFFLPGTAIDASDAIVVDGQEYEVIGQPWVARNPRTGTISHIEASLQRTVGVEEAS